MTTRTVDIIGAGITGLSTAWLLLRRGVSVRIHEARSAEAGLAGCFERDGFRFDFGPHEFCTQNAELVDMLREICGDDLMVIEKQVAQHFGGELLPFPFKPFDILRNLPFGVAARAVVDVATRQVAGMFRRPDDRNFETWTRSRFGPTLWRHYFGPYTEKVWGVAAERLDADVARRRISVDSAWELLGKMIRHHLGRGRGDAAAHSAFRHDFYYARQGIGTLATKLRRAVEEAGGIFHFDRRLVRIEADEAGGRVATLHFAGGDRVESVEQLVSTVPLPLLARLALGDAAESLLETHPLPFRGMVFSFVRLARPEFLGHHWVYVPDRDIPFQRLTEFARFGAAMEPEGTCGLALEIAANPGETWWEKDDEELGRACLEGLRRLSPLSEDEVLGVDIVRVRNVYPLQICGFEANTQAVLEALAPLRNLTTIGRQGLFRYCNMNECMEMAIDVAPRLAAGEDSVTCTTEASWRGVSLETADT